MIKNERQYKISKAAVKRFEVALRSKPIASQGIEKAIADAALVATKEQLSDLNSDISEYEALKAGTVRIMSGDSLRSLPEILVGSRIAAGLTQRDLAEKLGMKEQQIQRYEETRYEGASLSRLIDIAEASNLIIHQQAAVGTTVHSAATILKALERVGLPPALVRRRLVSSATSQVYAQDPSSGVVPFISELANRTARIFGWSIEQLLSGLLPAADTVAAGAARFKIKPNRRATETTAYTVYAHYLAMLLLHATEDLPVKKLPADPEQLYNKICLAYGSLTFENALRYIWSLGIPVLPLQDEGTFDGAYWRVDGRHVIVLKQTTNSSAKWLFDLLHDYCHATQNPDDADSEVIELPPASPERRESDDEIEASEFASEVILAGYSEDIVRDSEHLSGGDIARLKSVVPKIAGSYGLDVGAVANFLAFKLSLAGHNWWGAASKLQNPDGKPWETAKDVLVDNVNFGKINPVDRQILFDALSGRSDL